MADDHGLLSAALGSSTSDRGRTNRVSRYLAEHRNRVIAGLKLATKIDHNQSVYFLEVVGDPPDREDVVAPRSKMWGNGMPPTGERFS